MPQPCVVVVVIVLSCFFRCSLSNRRCDFLACRVRKNACVFVRVCVARQTAAPVGARVARLLLLLLLLLPPPPLLLRACFCAGAECFRVFAVSQSVARAGVGRAAAASSVWRVGERYAALWLRGETVLCAQPERRAACVRRRACSNKLARRLLCRFCVFWLACARAAAAAAAPHATAERSARRTAAPSEAGAHTALRSARRWRIARLSNAAHRGAGNLSV